MCKIIILKIIKFESIFKSNQSLLQLIFWKDESKKI